MSEKSWYVRVWDKEGKRQVYEHQVVAERKLGRKLLPGEVVDHRDGIKANNTPGNLQVFPSQSHHMLVEHMRRKRRSGIEPLFDFETLFEVSASPEHGENLRPRVECLEDEQ